MNLTPNFPLDEFIRSATASRHRINNDLPIALRSTAVATCEMLERIRSHVRAPVRITSGYRCLTLNRMLGSKDNSDHVRAMAADILVPSFGSSYALALALAPLVDDLGIGQLINEYPDAHGWVHVSTHRPAKVIDRVITIKHSGVEPGVRR